MENSIWRKLTAFAVAAVLCFAQVGAVSAKEVQGLSAPDVPASTALLSQKAPPASSEQTASSEEMPPSEETSLSSQETAPSQEEAASLPQEPVSSEEPVSSQEEEISSSEEETSSSDEAVSLPQEAASSTDEAAAPSLEEASSDEAIPSSEVQAASAEAEEMPGVIKEGTDEWYRAIALDGNSDGKPVGYRQYNAFTNAENLKGIETVTNKKKYNVQHAMNNFLINQAINNVDGAAWTYNGQTFYFNIGYIMSMLSWVSDANSKNISTSMVFLLQNEGGKEWLVDNPNAIGANYYAPAAEGVGAQAVEALFNYIAYILDYNGLSIDNWVLGNEVNNQARWNFMGTTDASVVADKYSTTFLGMYNAVRKYTSVSRCSISLDHNWTWSDRGREIPGRTMLDAFNAALESKQADVDWCVAYHPYPWEMSNTDLWNYTGYTPNSPGAMFISGINLNVLTDYIRNNFGAQHRVMITELGFSYYKGELYQAAALAITYYAALYNPMIDCFIIHWQNEDNGRHNFSLASPFTEDIYEKIGNGNEEDEAYIEGVIWQASGRWVSSMVPNYGVPVIQPDTEKINEFVTRLYKVCFNRDPDAIGLDTWTSKLANLSSTGAQVVHGIVFSSEFQSKYLSNRNYVQHLYQIMYGRAPSAEESKYWTDVLRAGNSRDYVFWCFAGNDEFKNLCAQYTVTAS